MELPATVPSSVRVTYTISPICPEVSAIESDVFEAKQVRERLHMSIKLSMNVINFLMEYSSFVFSFVFLF